MNDFYRHHSAPFTSSRLSNGYLERLACGLSELIPHTDGEGEASGRCWSSAYDTRAAIERQSKRELTARERPCVRKSASRREHLLAVRYIPGAAWKACGRYYRRAAPSATACNVDGNVRREVAERTHAVLSHSPLEVVRPGDRRRCDVEGERSVVALSNWRSQIHSVQSPRGVTNRILRLQAVCASSPRGGAVVSHSHADACRLARSQ